MRCLGRTETDRKITNEPWSSKQSLTEQNKTTLRSEWGCVHEKTKERQKKIKKGLDRADIVRDASLALPTSGSTLPFADFCDMVKVNRFTFSHESVTCRRSPEVSLTAFDAQPPDLQPVPFDGYGLRSPLPARPAPYASDPVLVHRLASLLCASFGPRLATSVISPLRFAITSRPSRCEEDFHLQTVKHARHTQKRAGLKTGPLDLTKDRRISQRGEGSASKLPGGARLSRCRAGSCRRDRAHSDESIRGREGGPCGVETSRFPWPIPGLTRFHGARSREHHAAPRLSGSLRTIDRRRPAAGGDRAVLRRVDRGFPALPAGGRLPFELPRLHPGKLR